MRPVMLVISEVSFAPTFEWLAEIHHGGRVNLQFVLLNPAVTPLEERLLAAGISVTRFTYRGKKDFVATAWRLFRHFRSTKPAAVHTHMIGANLCGLFAAWLARVPRRIHTRHHSSLSSVSGVRRELAYDRIINTLSSQIIATSDNVSRYLTGVEGVESRKVTTIRFGFPEERFAPVGAERLAGVRARHGYAGKAPVVGMISRFVKWKGIPAAIEAFHRVLAEYPDACIVLANAGPGDDRAHVLELLGTLPPTSYRLVRFEEDAAALLQSFDIFVHVPVDPVCEAFGQVYVEALLSGVPSVFTLSGVAREFVEHERNALVVPFGNPGAIASAVLRLLAEPALAARLSERGHADAATAFPVGAMVQAFEKFYG
jgi:glycosyltransferase involved in cell wall biosynthesis